MLNLVALLNYVITCSLSLLFQELPCVPTNFLWGISLIALLHYHYFTNIFLHRNNEDSFVDNLMLGVQLADVSTRCSSHPQGKSEARCEIDGNFSNRVSAWTSAPDRMRAQAQEPRL